jgi:DNA-binding transcriptional LysR family regulator
MGVSRVPAAESTGSRPAARANASIGVAYTEINLVRKQHGSEPLEFDERSINLSQLITLSLVVKHQSFSRAAEEMNLSQPTVSQQIRELERSIGQPVIITQGRSIKVTAVGADLAEIGRRLAIERERAFRLAEQHLEGTAGKLTIAASLTTSTYVLPPVVAKLTKTLPDTTVEMRVANTFDVAQMVSDDVVDIGVVEGDIHRPELSVVRFADDTLTCIAAASSHFRDGLLRPGDVAEQTLLVREDGSGTRQVVAEALSKRGFAFKRILAFGNNESIKAGVHYGLGIAWLSRRAVQEDVSNHKLRELQFDSQPITRALSYVRRRDVKPSPLGDAFIAALTAS